MNDPVGKKIVPSFSCSRNTFVITWRQDVSSEIMG